MTKNISISLQIYIFQPIYYCYELYLTIAENLPQTMYNKYIFVVKIILSKYNRQHLRWPNVGPASQTVAQHWANVGPTYNVTLLVRVVRTNPASQTVAQH